MSSFLLDSISIDKKGTHEVLGMLRRPVPIQYVSCMSQTLAAIMHIMYAARSYSAI